MGWHKGYKYSSEKKCLDCCSIFVAVNTRQKACKTCSKLNRKFWEKMYLRFKSEADPEFRLKRAKWNRKNYLLYMSNPENKRKELLRKRARQFNRNRLSKTNIEDLQEVYENNIKKFGTLTCYLCLKPVAFGEDSIDHKIPISKNGNNNKTNLEVAHLICNIKKGNKILKESCFV